MKKLSRKPKIQKRSISRNMPMRSIGMGRRQRRMLEGTGTDYNFDAVWDRIRNRIEEIARRNNVDYDIGWDEPELIASATKTDCDDLNAPKNLDLYEYFFSTMLYGTYDEVYNARADFNDNGAKGMHDICTYFDAFSCDDDAIDLGEEPGDDYWGIRLTVSFFAKDNE